MHLVVDIDQTLFPLLSAISTLPGGEKVKEENCQKWESLQNMCEKPLQEMIHAAIQPEVAEKIGLYPGAKEVLEDLAQTNIDIAIATLRHKKYRDVTSTFLKSQGLDGFPLYIGEELEKMDLLFKDGLLIDDAPYTIRKASERGTKITTLAHPYNEDMSKKYFVERARDWYQLERIISSSIY